MGWFPTLCGLAGIPVPRSVEGTDLSAVLKRVHRAAQDDVFLMNFSKWFDWFQDGAEWRGVRTETHLYARWLDGRELLQDLTTDPWQQSSCADDAPLLKEMRERLAAHQARRRDALVPCTDWKHWLDDQRRVVRNAFGELSHPESLPDWSLLH